MNLLDLQSDPAQFREALLIDTDNGAAPFAERMDDWQDRDFRALDSGWQRAVLGAEHEATYQRGWLERGRGHSKTQDLGVMAAWALFASVRRLSLIGCAADIDQARLLRDGIGKLVYVNPWLGKVLEVQNYRVLNTRTGSSLDIISSDAKTSYGLTPDAIICDEVVHWKNRDLWDSILSSAAKRSTCMLVVITNAGLDADWQWLTREAIRQDPKWYFSRLEGPVASWISAEILDEQRRLLPSIAFARLWTNTWVSGSADFVSPEVIAAAFYPDLRPMGEAVSGYEYVCGLDCGIVRDATGLCVLGVRRGHDGHGRIRLAYTRVWRPSKTQKVNLQDVEDTLVALHARYKFKQLNYDPWEMRGMASRLQSGNLGRFAGETKYGKQRPESLPMVEVPPTGKNLQAVATAVIEAFNDHRVELYEDADLRRDLNRLRVEERPYGFRLTCPRDELGHGDLGTAFSLAMLAASELAGKRLIQAGAVDIFGGQMNMMDRFDMAEERFQQIMRDLETRPDDWDEWRKAMRRVGRTSHVLVDLK